jgi:hypothetical protein
VSDAKGWRGTGVQVEIPGDVDRVPPYDPMLDQENLLTIVGPGCFYCEQPWSPRLARRRCPGEPR